MKHLLLHLNTAIGTDSYGTSELTFGQLYLALGLILIFFIWIAKKRSQWAKMDK